MADNGLVIAGLGSGSGKTTLTLGMLRALTRRGTAVGAAKSGPDYIDTAFLTAACGTNAVNLDSHAMPLPMLRDVARRQAAPLLLIEGVMGLFDGTDGGSGSTAALANALGLPVLLVIDVRHKAQTAAAIAAGIGTVLAPAGQLAGVVLNRVASDRHQTLIAEALSIHDIPLFGSLPSSPDIEMPSRHLGLVQAADLAAENVLETRLDAAADLVSAHLDLDRIMAAAAPLTRPETPDNASGSAASIPPIPMPPFLAPPGQRIAVAADAAFGFAYAHMLAYWRDAGAEILPFSPLADEAPAGDADAIFLPGGYPELHLPRLSSASRFLDGLRDAASKSVRIYGECGGFMTLGQRIIDKDGAAFSMARLLDLETSFAARKLHLGYRQVAARHGGWPGTAPLTAHEFHYTTATSATGDPLFDAVTPSGKPLGPMGLVNGTVSGSYAHIIA